MNKFYKTTLFLHVELLNQKVYQNSIKRFSQNDQLKGRAW